jgi:hypothetical protein
MLGATHPLPQYVFVAWCLVKHRDISGILTGREKWKYLRICSNVPHKTQIFCPENELLPSW